MMGSTGGNADFYKTLGVSKDTHGTIAEATDLKESECGQREGVKALRERGVQGCLEEGEGSWRARVFLEQPSVNLQLVQQNL